MSRELGATFQARFDSECAECNCSTYEGDLVGYLDGSVVCDACWNEADLDATRDLMAESGVTPGPLPGQPALDPALQAVIDAAKAQLQAEAAPELNTNPVAMKMEPELAAIIENTQAIVARHTAPLIEFELDPTGLVVLDGNNQPVLKGELWRICDQCNAGGHTCPGCGDDVSHWRTVCEGCRAANSVDPALQAVIDAAWAQLNDAAVSLEDSPVESAVESAVEPPVDLLSIEDRQAQYLLKALGVEPTAESTLESVLDLLPPYLGPVPVTAFVEEVKDFLVRSVNNQERTLQKMIGPSEIGTPCDHCLAAKLAQWTERRDTAWLPTVGSAVHDWLERKVKAEMKARAVNERGWLAEVKVFCGYINGEEVWGTVDLADVIRGFLLDWKIVGKTTLDTVGREDNVSPVYEVQRQVYMDGLNKAGIRITHAVNAYLPRNSPNVIKDSEWPDGKYDPEIAAAAFQRADTMARALERIEQQGGTEARDAYISLLPRERDKDGKISCYSCKRYDDFPAEAEREPLDLTYGGMIEL